MKPLVKWAGGKGWLVPRMRELYRRHDHLPYCEPFAGGMAIGLELLPKHAMFCDLNGSLINLYRQIQLGLTSFDLDMRNDETLYYRHRARFNSLRKTSLRSSKEAAQLFWYLNRTGYNGLCRFNRSGGFNVPFGKYAAVNYEPDLMQYAETFEKWYFISASFESLNWGYCGRPSFVFADPPYHGTFDGYCGRPFTWREQEALAKKLAEHQGPVVATNAATPEILELYGDHGFEIELLEGRRSISCKASGRKPASEMLATLRIAARER